MLMGTLRGAFEHETDDAHCAPFGRLVKQSADAGVLAGSLVGAACKIGQNMGLSRLGPEVAGKKWPDLWNTFKKREVGRRTWWGLVSSPEGDAR